MSKGGTGSDASITISLLKTILTDNIKPEIKEGIWYIGGVSTGVSAGSVQLRLGDNGIEYRYSDNDEWAMLITVSKLQEPAVTIAEELKTHPCKVSETYTWLVWDAVNKLYIDTGISARGRSPIIRDMIWWVWDDLTGDYISTGQAVNDSAVDRCRTDGRICPPDTAYTVHVEYRWPIRQDERHTGRFLGRKHDAPLHWRDVQ